jgi:hypothetical protein
VAGSAAGRSGRAVAMCRLVIDPHVSFKFKFDRLNLKTSRFYH